MLTYWQSHQEYLHFLHEANMEYLSAFYSHTGRPAKSAFHTL